MAERVCVPLAVNLQRHPMLSTLAPLGTPSRTGSPPRTGGGAGVKRIHPALAELLLMLALAAWLRLASGGG
ncbi:MAG: hypothetical protein ACLPKW_15310 [Acetobacteraceae bacterium]